MKHLILLLALLAPACASSDAQPEKPRRDVIVGEDGVAYLPLPYTVAQIRERCVEGLELDLKVQSRGAPAQWQRMRFHDWSEDAVNIAMRVELEDGRPVTPPTDARRTWEELQLHGRFRADGAVRVRDQLDTTFGTLPCWCYIVATQEGGTQRLWFADALPGPPVRVDLERDGEQVMRMTLVAARLPE